MSSIDTVPLRMMASLGLAGLCSGVAVVGIFLATKPRIERNRAEALEAAIFRVVEGARSRAAFVVRGEALVPFEGAAGTVPQEEAVYAGYDESGALLGFAIPAEGSGFQDTIKLIYGVEPSGGRIVGMEVLESRETPGLGDKIMKDPDFLASFRDLAVEPSITAVKTKRVHPNEVDAISGATISSNAVVRILNDSNEHWLGRVTALAKSGVQRTGSD